MFLITLSVTNEICHFLMNGKLFLLSSTVTLFVNDFYEGKRIGNGLEIGNFHGTVSIIQPHERPISYLHDSAISKYRI